MLIERPMMMMNDVLTPAAGRLGHLVVLAAFGVVDFVTCLAVVESEETPTKTQRLKLDDGRKREGMQFAETAVFIEELRHGIFDVVDLTDPVNGVNSVNPVTDSSARKPPTPAAP